MCLLMWNYEENLRNERVSGKLGKIIGIGKGSKIT